MASDSEIDWDGAGGEVYRVALGGDSALQNAMYVRGDEEGPGGVLMLAGSLPIFFDDDAARSTIISAKRILLADGSPF